MKKIHITPLMPTSFRGRIDSIAKAAYASCLCQLPTNFIMALRALRRSNFCSALSFKPLRACRRYVAQNWSAPIISIVGLINFLAAISFPIKQPRSQKCPRLAPKHTCLLIIHQLQRFLIFYMHLYLLIFYYQLSTGFPRNQNSAQFR